MKTFFTSDLHFGHHNIIAFDGRPFDSIDEMDSELIRRWNAKVGKGDLVYILGDLIWKSANPTKLVRSLNGQKILIKGNHDQWFHTVETKTLLSEIKDYDDIIVILDSGEIKRCILSHYPIHFYNGHYHGAIMLYGHVHRSLEYDLTKDYAKWLNDHECSVEMYNVGTMCWNYEPVTLDEILEKSMSSDE